MLLSCSNKFTTFDTWSLRVEISVITGAEGRHPPIPWSRVYSDCDNLQITNKEGSRTQGCRQKGLLNPMGMDKKEAATSLASDVVPLSPSLCHPCVLEGCLVPYSWKSGTHQQFIVPFLFLVPFFPYCYSLASFASHPFPQNTLPIKPGGIAEIKLCVCTLLYCIIYLLIWDSSKKFREGLRYLKVMRIKWENRTGNKIICYKYPS